LVREAKALITLPPQCHLSTTNHIGLSVHSWWEASDKMPELWHGLLLLLLVTLKKMKNDFCSWYIYEFGHTNKNNTNTISELRKCIFYQCNLSVHLYIYIYTTFYLSLSDMRRYTSDLSNTLFHGPS
jgi:hypothetical protein